MNTGPYRSAFRGLNSPERAALMELKASLLSALEDKGISIEPKMAFSELSIDDVVSMAERAGYEFVVAARPQDPTLLGRYLSRETRVVHAND